MGSKNIASYRWRDSGDVDFLKESFKGDPRCTIQYPMYMYIQYNAYMYKYIHTYEADVNLMYVHIVLIPESPPRWIVSKG